MVNFGEHTYPILDKEFPQSKFILTIRDKESWLRSVYFLLKDNWQISYTDDGRIDGLLSLIRKMHIFHTVDYDDAYFSILYDNHLRNVEHYFKGREQDLLTIDICGGEGWERLCQFLGKEVPDVSFPHRNKTISNK